MSYLDWFTLAGEDAEWHFIVRALQKSHAYPDFYPFQVFPDKQLTQVRFEPVTIFYGDNGSGKSTLLNIIAEKLKLKRSTLFNRAAYFDQYLDLCNYQLQTPLPKNSAIITSDEVFDAMLNTRALNQGIDTSREDMFKDYLANKFGDFHYHDLTDFDQLKKVLETRSKTQSRYVREHLAKNAREYSNGESAIQYFQNRLQDNHLYLLDEPENSLSPMNQQKLARQLADSARFFGCQFIIATHSPFVLAIPHAKIYDLDVVPVQAKPWQQLPEVKAYADFFKAHQQEFD